MLIHPQTKLIREPRLMVPRQHPLGPVRVDWSNPLTSGLVAVMCAPAMTNLARGNPITLVGPDISRDLGGFKWVNTPTADSYLSLEQSIVDLTGKRNTYLAVGIKTIATRDQAIFTTEIAGETDGLLFLIASDGRIRLRSGGINAVNSSTTPVTTNSVFCAAVTTKTDATAAYVQGESCSFNGKTVAASLSFCGPISAPGVRFGFNVDFNTNSWAGYLFLVCAWTTSFPQAVLNELTRDPYQFLVPA